MLSTNVNTANRRCPARTRRRRSDALRQPHELAIRHLMTAFRREPAVYGRFHSGVDWRACSPLVASSDIDVERGHTVRVDSKRYVPDLLVRARVGGKILLLVEVWHTHAVSERKRRAYQALGVRWVEIKCWHILAHRPGAAFPLLDWGGFEGINSPYQSEISMVPPTHVAQTASDEASPAFDLARFAQNWQHRTGIRATLRL